VTRRRLAVLDFEFRDYINETMDNFSGSVFVLMCYPEGRAAVQSALDHYVALSATEMPLSWKLLEQKRRRQK
jgi:hypothetical protein